MKVLWLMPPSKFRGEVPLVSQNRWFKYLPSRTNFIYPVIAAYGVTIIKNAGHRIDFLDAPAENVELKEVFRRVRVGSYDLIIMEGRTAIIRWIWELAGYFKTISHRRLKIALYGDHVMVRPEESLDKGIDYIIHCGDYDYGAWSLVDSLEHGFYTPRIFKQRLMPDLDKLPHIDRDLVPWENYFETWRHKEDFGWVQSGRGCWAKCTFCSWVYTFYQHTIRVMSPERVADEIGYASEKWGIKEYLDDADTFLTKWGLKFAKELSERGLDIYWNMQTRADEILKGSINDWKLLKKSGLHIVKLGIDGWSDYSLQRVRKGYNIDCAEKAVKRLRDAGLEVHVNMVIGYPWESKRLAYDGIKWVKNLKPNQAQFSLIEPFPGTPIFEEAVKEGWFVNDPYDWDKYDMKSPILEGEMSSKEISQLHRDAWAKFYLNPGFMTRQFIKSTKLALKEGNLDSFRHLWRGYKGVTQGHMRAVKSG